MNFENRPFFLLKSCRSFRGNAIGGNRAGPAAVRGKWHSNTKGLLRGPLRDPIITVI